MLDVTQRSSTREVKAAYHRVALANHPDKVPRSVFPRLDALVVEVQPLLLVEVQPLLLVGVTSLSFPGPVSPQSPLGSLLLHVKHAGSADALEAADKFMKVQRAFETVMDSRKKANGT